MNEEKLFHLDIPVSFSVNYAVLPGDPGRVDLIASYLDDPQFLAYNREFRSVVGELCRKKVIVTSTGIGGPSAAIALEELSMIGVNTAVRVGTCGGMSPAVSPGDLIISTAAVRMEGTSKEYAPIEYPAVADFNVTYALVMAARENSFSFHTGVTQSKDSFYGQHCPESMPVSNELLNKWQAWKKLGVLGSEMEAAALFTVGAVRGVAVGCVLNTIWNQEISASGAVSSPVKNMDPAVKTAVTALRILCGGEHG